jgi:hypothetical protein
MTNVLERAINTDDPDRAAKIIQHVLGIESDEVANYCFPKTCRISAGSVPGLLATGRRDFWRE